MVLVKGYFVGVSKWVSKWFIELCGDFVQFWVIKKVMNDLDSGRWILELACEWNTYPGIDSGRIKSKCKTPPG